MGFGRGNGLRLLRDDLEQKSAVSAMPAFVMRAIGPVVGIPPLASAARRPTAVRACGVARPTLHVSRSSQNVFTLKSRSESRLRSASASVDW